MPTILDIMEDFIGTEFGDPSNLVGNIKDCRQVYNGIEIANYIELHSAGALLQAPSTLPLFFCYRDVNEKKHVIAVNSKQVIHTLSLGRGSAQCT